MNNNVVTTIFEKTIKKDITTLRFNFRGVGRSTGMVQDGEGNISDVLACFNFLQEEKKVKKVLICGYSYGAAVGTSIVNNSDKIIGFCAISFPWDFMNPKYKKMSLTEKPKLFIQGDQDNIAPYDRFLKHYHEYPDPKEKVIIHGADHFYWGYEENIANEVVSFYENLINSK